MLSGEPVNRQQFVANQEWCLAPDEDVADPAAGTACPAGTETVDVTAGDPDRSDEFARLLLEPTPTPERQCRDGRDDDHIHAQHNEQGYQHDVGSPITSRPRGSAVPALVA